MKLLIEHMNNILHIVITNNHIISDLKYKSKKLSEEFIQLLNLALRESQYLLKDFELIGVNIGPTNSFIGLRVILSSVIALAANLNIPLLTKSSYEILLSSLNQKNTLLIPIIPSNYPKIYFSGIFSLNGEIVKNTPNLSELYSIIKQAKQFDKEITFIGQIDEEIPKNINYIKTNIDISKNLSIWNSNKKHYEPNNVKPIYLTFTKFETK